MAAVAGGIGLGVAAKADHDNWQQPGLDLERWGDLKSSGENKQLAANVMIGVGVALAVTSAVLFFIEGRGKERRQALGAAIEEELKPDPHLAGVDMQVYFDEAELEQALSDVEQQLADAGEPPRNKAPRKKRKGLSDKLPRIRIDLPLSDEDKAGASRTFFTKVKEELDIVPAKSQVIEYWQEKAVFDDEFGEQRIVAAPRQPHPLGKCIASVGLLAYLIVAKYADALPLYRLEGMLKRYGGCISRTTMANWIIRLDSVLQPLINLLHEHQLSSDYLQADETRIQVLKETGKVAASDKWMWLIRGGPPEQPVVLFTYDVSRSEAVPSRLLEGFEGVLQTDGYAGYNQVCRDNPITRIGCWDHARRKFVEASKAAPAKKKGQMVSKADVAIGKIRKLYAIEDRIKDLKPEHKAEQRQTLAQPVLDDLKNWLLTDASRVP